MKFRRAHFENFRLLRDVDLDFSCEPKKPLTVIRAENETGKTTILSALQWVLFGEDGLPTKGPWYRIIPIDWDLSKSDSAEISVELEFEHTFERRDGKRGFIETSETYLARRRATEVLQESGNSRRFDDTFELFKKGEGGYQPTKGGDLIVRQILGTNLKDLFFTDGDRALTFITSEIQIGERRKAVRTAIRDMLGFELLEAAEGHVRRAFKKIRDENRDLSGNEDVANALKRLQQLEEKEAENNNRLSDIEGQLMQIEDRIHETEKKIERALEKGNRDELIGAKQAKEEELKKTKTRLESVKREHSELFRSEALGYAILKSHITTASNMVNTLQVKGRIPRESIPVLRKRLDMGECICGETLKPGTSRYQNVEKLISQQETASVVDNRLIELGYASSEKIAKFGDTNKSWTSQLRSVLERRTDIEDHIKTLEIDLKLLETRIQELPDIDIGFLKGQRKQLLETKDSLGREQSVRFSDRDRIAKEKKKANDEHRSLLAAQTRYRKVKCRLDATQDVLDVIATSYDSIEKEEIPRVSSAMNKYFLDMIQADPQHGIIRRADIVPTYEIAVYGPKERRLDTDIDLNGASRRALTLAFILALTEVSGVKAPNIIDTPLGMTSGLVKQSILQTAISNTSQLILFLTRAEITGCQDIIDKSAGKIYTVTNSAHYPKQLVNNPGSGNMRSIRCDCDHRHYCKLCEHIGDSDSPDLKRKGK